MSFRRRWRNRAALNCPAAEQALCDAEFQSGLYRFRVKRVISVRSRRSRNVRYASNTDRIDASQQNVAMCQKATFALQQIFLFDDPLGDGKQFTRHRETERSSSLQVDE